MEMSGASCDTLQCQICAKPCGLEFQCPGCHAISYCSAEHRRGHFETHRENCARLKIQLSRTKVRLGKLHHQQTIEKGVNGTISTSMCTTDRSQCGGKALCDFLTSCGCHGSPLWTRVCPVHGSYQRFGEIGKKRIMAVVDNHGAGGKKRRATSMNPATSDVNKIPKREDPLNVVRNVVESTSEIDRALQPSVMDGSQSHQSTLPTAGNVSDIPSNCGSFILKRTDTKSDIWGLPENDVPAIGEAVPDSFHLNSWLSCYQHFGVSPSSPVALLLHFPLTLFLGISLAANGGQMPHKTSIRVHYLGPQDELDILEVFGVLMDLLPGARILIDFIGPDVSTELDGRQLEILPTATAKSMGENPPRLCSWDDLELVNYQEMDMLCPPPPFPIDKYECGEVRPRCLKHETDSSNQREKEETGSMTMRFWRGVYHEWIGNSSDLHGESKEPGLVFAPNAGLEAYPSWLPTIQMLSRTGSFTMFTDYGEEAIVRPAKMLKSWGLNVGRAFVNLFRQPLLRLDSGNMLPCYSNGFGFVMNDGS